MEQLDLVPPIIESFSVDVVCDGTSPGTRKWRDFSVPHVPGMTATYSEWMHLMLFASFLRTKHNVLSPLRSVQIKSLAGLFCELSVSFHPRDDKFCNEI